MSRPRAGRRALEGSPWLLSVLLIVSPVSGASATPGPCDELQGALAAVPHVHLTRTDGRLEWLWNGDAVDGCQVDFETNDSTLAGATPPDFYADPGTELYEAGWRMIPEILADGAGSGIHGIRRDGVRCVVRWEQPAYLDDDGELVVSDTRSVLVQCTEG